MTNAALKAMAEAALDVAKPRWRDIERKAKAALVRDVKAAIKAATVKGEVDEVQS